MTINLDSYGELTSILIVLFVVLTTISYFVIKRSWTNRRQGGTYFATANTASTMGPLFEKFLKQGSRILITGGDAVPLTPEYRDNNWQKRLKSWLKKGVEIQYLIVSPKPEVMEAAAELMSGNHRIVVFVIDREKLSCAPAADRVFVENLKTFHPTLAWDPAMMWLEGYHGPGAFTAEDCEFVEPKSISGDSRFAYFAHRLEHVADQLCRKMTTADEVRAAGH